MRILVADDNAAFREFVTSTVVASLGYEVIQARNGAEALKLALSQPAPDILLLDWLMPELSGRQVCNLVRASALPTQPYIIFATSRVRAEEAIAALSAGADDLLAKPIPADVLTARLGVPRTRGSAQGPKQVWLEVARACQRGSGELAVTSGELTARILVHDGRIAWAHLADPTDNLFETLAPGSGINAETAQAVVRECQSAGTTLSETLVAWGLVDRARLRDALRGWIERKLEAICRMPTPQVLFLPARRVHSRDVLFDLSEVTPSAWEAEDFRVTEPPVSLSRAPTLIPSRGWDAAFARCTDDTLNVDGLLLACREVQGLLGAALINRDTGGCLGRYGVEMDPDMAWSMIQCVNTAEQSAQVGETIVTTRGHFHFAALLDQRSDVLVYALVDSTENLAAARYGLRRVLKQDGSTALKPSTARAQGAA